MGPINLGPEWLWKFIAGCALLGFMGVLYLVVKLALWAISFI